MTGHIGRYMKLNNVTQINEEDFDKDDQNVAGKIGNILNPFMQQLVEIADGRIDFENRVENYREIEMTVDANGVPTLNDKIKTGKGSIRGITVIAAFNLTNSSGYATQQPWISYQPISGGIIQVSKITGLLPNQKYRLNVIFH